VKVSEAQALEIEVQRLREENAELRRKNNEIGSLEAAKKRADAKVESLEQKVRPLVTRPVCPVGLILPDGRSHQRTSGPEGGRAERDL
jgi:hypothetical protein